MDYSGQSTRGVTSNNEYANAQVASAESYTEGVNRTATVPIVNIDTALPSTSTMTNLASGSASAQDFSMAFYQQQLMLNHQLFMQQQQTVSALIGKVDNLSKLVDKKEQPVAQVDEITKVKQLRRQIIRGKTHAISDSDLQDISSDSDNSHSDSDEEISDNEIVNNAQCNLEVTDNMKLLRKPLLNALA